MSIVRMRADLVDEGSPNRNAAADVIDRQGIRDVQEAIDCLRALKGYQWSLRPHDPVRALEIYRRELERCLAERAEVRMSA